MVKKVNTVSTISMMLQACLKENILFNEFSFLNEIAHILDLFIQDKKLN